MIIVADTSPINYLVLIGQERILHLLFRHVLIPQAVHDELKHPDTPEIVQEWAAALPEWVSVVVLSEPLPSFGLDGGETAAIVLAQRLGADRLLLDERAARQVAQSHDLVVTGTLGVLDNAAARGLIHLPTAFDALRKTTFRVSETLVQELLRQDAARQSVE